MTRASKTIQMRWTVTSNHRGASKTRQMRWTETGNLRLIEAVIQVEQEMMNESKRMANGNGVNKWRRIVNRLPPELQEKTWDSRSQSYGGRYKCQSQFCTLLQGYRDRLAGRATQASKYPPTEIVERVSNFSNKVQREEGTHVDQDEASEKDTAESTQPSRSVIESKHLQKKCVSTQNLIQNRLQTRAQTEFQIQDFRPTIRRQYTERRDSLVKRKYTETQTVPESDDREHVQAIVKRTLRKINVEVSRLSSWMENHMVAAGKTVAHEIISSEIASDKRRKFSGHRPCSFRVPEDFDDFARKTLSRIIDNQIGSSFQKLRIRFEEELKDTSLELAEKILNSYPHSMFETMI